MNFSGGTGSSFFSLGKTGALLAHLFLAAALTAGPLEVVRDLSLFQQVDLPRLKKGQIMVRSGPVGDFPRGISLEACYFIHAPMQAVGDALLHWNPVDHKDVDTRLYREFSPPPSPDVFQALQLNPKIADDQWLIEETAKVAGGGRSDDLHLTNEEVEIIRQHAQRPEEAWRVILQRRSETAARSLAAVAPYRAGEAISPGSEFRGLLTLAPKAAKHFRPIISAAPFAGKGKPASEIVGYWEASKVRNHNTLQLGLFAAQKSADSWQLIDCLYYPSDTYFMSLNLFQLWPLEGGTLVWQVGFVSAPFRAYLGGIDRYVAGKMMTEETIDTVKAFRDDVEKGR